MTRRLKTYFPMKGKNTNFVTSTQPNLTSPDMNNVFPVDVLGAQSDVLGGRARGGQRPGMNRQFLADIGNGKPVVCMGHVTTVEL